MNSENINSKNSSLDIGRILALSLSISATPSDNELKEAENIGLNANQYFNEIYFLCGFSVSYAITIALRHTSHFNDVSSGYMEVWENRAKESQIEAGLLRVFKSRLQPYYEAIDKLGLGPLDGIALRFSSYFGTPSAEAYLMMDRYVSSYHQAHVESTLNMLRDEGLI
jgi:hypothetical protein